jgi:hypothetical protein
MADKSASNEVTRGLKRRREELWASLPVLSQNRADTYRVNSDALALGRAGVKYQEPQEVARLGAAEVAADDAIRVVQREIRQLDEEIDRASGGARKGFGSRAGRAMRGARAGR